MKNLISVMVLLLGSINFSFAETYTISGKVESGGLPVEYSQVVINETTKGAVTKHNGAFKITDIENGKYSLTASFLGYKSQSKEIQVKNASVELIFDLEKDALHIDDIVVTGTKTAKRKTNSPVIVNVMSSQDLKNVQACNLSEGLKFQPGLRVETNCQTCNYTQLRMNGLSGGYSQILINGRPIFSPLTGLYGLEQLPANMVDRIEVVRGGGSSLYGSSAIGGTVNILTKVPKYNAYSLDYNVQSINGESSDYNLNGNASVVSKNGKSGLSFFLNRRERDFYDHNNDNFSELPLLKNTALGANFFALPTDDQKIEFSLSYTDEYRFGGEMKEELPAYQTLQSEERVHNVWMSSFDYQINFNNNKSSLISYFAWQNTDRKHYTGAQPEKSDKDYNQFMLNPPYGTSQVKTYNFGVQFNHEFETIFEKSVATLGSEYIYDDVFDEIKAYDYLTDQTTKNIGAFLQLDIELVKGLNLLSGLRADKHNLIDNWLLNPRASILYKYKQNTQFRVGVARGFRAPQAFDTDLHMEFAAGGISRVSLDPELSEEKSTSYSASINYDFPTEHYVVGYTFEGFYNKLDDVFFRDPAGEDEHGQIFIKRNGSGAIVQGATLELRANYDGIIQIESGITVQKSEYEQAVEPIENVAADRDFMRTPKAYGYATASLQFSPNLSLNFNYVYTGSMKVPHVAGADNHTVDEVIHSGDFSNLSSKIAYKIPIKAFENRIEVYAGMRNMFNKYQNDFDIGKNRDSNFIYGPSLPRTIYVGLKLFNF